MTFTPEEQAAYALRICQYLEEQIQNHSASSATLPFWQDTEMTRQELQLSPEQFAAGVEWAVARGWLITRDASDAIQ